MCKFVLLSIAKGLFGVYWSEIVLALVSWLVCYCERNDVFLCVVSCLIVLIIPFLLELVAYKEGFPSIYYVKTIELGHFAILSLKYLHSWVNVIRYQC